MSPNRETKANAHLRDISVGEPTSDIEKAVAAAFLATVSEKQASQPDIIPKSEEDKKGFLLTLYREIASRASKASEIRQELKRVKLATETWYRALTKRVLRTGPTYFNKNPWLEQARRYTGIENPSSDANIGYLVQIKLGWTQSRERMGLLEKRLLAQSKPKNSNARELFQALLQDEAKMFAFEADMDEFRKLSYELSVEYLKIV